MESPTIRTGPLAGQARHRVAHCGTSCMSPARPGGALFEEALGTYARSTPDPPRWADTVSQRHRYGDRHILPTASERVSIRDMRLTRDGPLASRFPRPSGRKLTGREASFQRLENGAPGVSNPWKLSRPVCRDGHPPFVPVSAVPSWPTSRPVFVPLVLACKREW